MGTTSLNKKGNCTMTDTPRQCHVCNELSDDWDIDRDTLRARGPTRAICGPCLARKGKAKSSVTELINYIHGAAYDPDLDGTRLGNQMQRILALMIDGKWRTLQEIAAITHDPEASISAQLRNARKKWGRDVMEKRRRPSVSEMAGLWEYRIVLDEGAQ